jgi:hypothetical protein
VLALSLLAFWPAMIVLSSSAAGAVQYTLAFALQFLYLWGIVVVATSIKPGLLGHVLIGGAAACLPGICAYALAFGEVSELVTTGLLVVQIVLGVPWNVMYWALWYGAGDWLNQPSSMGRDWGFLGTGGIYGSFLGAFINGSVVAWILASRKMQARGSAAQPWLPADLALAWWRHIANLRDFPRAESKRAWVAGNAVSLLVAFVTIGGLLWLVLFLWNGLAGSSGESLEFQPL